MLGLSKDIRHHNCMTPYSFKLQKNRLHSRPHVKRTVSLVIADGHFNHPSRFCVGMYGLTLSPPRVYSGEMYFLKGIIPVAVTFILMYTKYRHCPTVYNASAAAKSIA